MGAVLTVVLATGASILYFSGAFTALQTKNFENELYSATIPGGFSAVDPDEHTILADRYTSPTWENWIGGVNKLSEISVQSETALGLDESGFTDLIDFYTDKGTLVDSRKITFDNNVSGYLVAWRLTRPNAGEGVIYNYTINRQNNNRVTVSFFVHNSDTLALTYFANSDDILSLVFK